MCLPPSNQSEMRQRFDEVALDNRAALKQQITRECAVAARERAELPQATPLTTPVKNRWRCL